jgi:hypothetical protein
MRTLLTEIQATFRLERDEIQQAKRLRWEQSYDAQAVLYGLPGPREGIFATCEELLQAGSVEERTLAFD